MSSSFSVSSSSSSSPIWEFITSSALSLAVSGNTGISPFLTIFLLGCVEMVDPSLLKMNDTVETIVASWPAITITGLLTLVEIIGKCIPVVDQFIDSIEIFIVPVLSVFASLATLGLLDWIVIDSDDNGDDSDGGSRRILLNRFGKYDNETSSWTYETQSFEFRHELDRSFFDDDYHHRGLQDDVNIIADQHSTTNGWLLFVKIILIVMGVILALLIHLFKMIVRLMDLGCCAGCCHPCITIWEISIVIVGVLVSIFIQPIAIVTCLMLMTAASYVLLIRCRRSNNNNNNNDENKNEPNNRENNPNGQRNTTNDTGESVTSQNTDIERQSEILQNQQQRFDETSALSSENYNRNSASDNDHITSMVSGHFDCETLVIATPVPPSAPLELNEPPPPPPPAINPSYRNDDNNDNNIELAHAQSSSVPPSIVPLSSSASSSSSSPYVVDGSKELPPLVNAVPY